MDHDLQKILDKAAKLKNLSDRAGTPEEAALAATRLQELLLRHNIDMQSLPMEEETYVKEEFELQANRNSKTWQSSLYSAIAKANQCEAIRLYQGRGETPKMCVVGRTHNIQVINYLFTYLCNEIIRLSKQHNKSALFQRSFCVGATVTVTKRVLETLQKVKYESQNNNEVMVVEEKLVHQMFKAEFPHTQTSSISIGSRAGYDNGKKAGESIAIRPGINSSQKLLT